MRNAVVSGLIQSIRMNKDGADWVLTIAEEFGGAAYGLIDIKSFA